MFTEAVEDSEMPGDIAMGGATGRRVTVVVLDEDVELLRVTTVDGAVDATVAAPF